MWKCVWVTGKGRPLLPLALPCLYSYSSWIHSRVKETWSNCAQAEEGKTGLVCRKTMNTAAAISHTVVRDQWYRETEGQQLKRYLHKCSVLQIWDFWWYWWWLVCWFIYMCVLSHVWLFVTAWTFFYIYIYKIMIICVIWVIIDST